MGQTRSKGKKAKEESEEGRIYEVIMRGEVGQEFTGRIIKFLAEESVFPLV